MQPSRLFPRGVEVTAASIIRDQKNRILLIASTKQKGKWTFPGGHVEPGESILEAATREAYEETGLKVTPIAVVNYGELINPPDFHRTAHFIYFDCLLETLTNEVNLETDEASNFCWCLPEEALYLDLAKGYSKSIEGYIDYLGRLTTSTA